MSENEQKKDDTLKQDFSHEPKYYFEEDETEDKKDDNENPGDNSEKNKGDKNMEKETKSDEKKSVAHKKEHEKHVPKESGKESKKEHKDDNLHHHKKAHKSVRKKKNSSKKGIIIGTLIVIAIIVGIIFLLNLNKPLTIKQEVKFNSKDKIILAIDGKASADFLKLYSDRSMSLEFEKGIDYEVTAKYNEDEDKTVLTITRSDNGLIPEESEVFLYYQEKTEPGQNENKEDGKGNGVVAVVNGKEITDEQLLADYNTFFIIAGYPESYKAFITLKNYVNQSILEHLLLQEAEKRGITATEEEINTLKENYYEQTMQNESVLADKLEQVGLTIEDANKFFEKNIIIGKLINETISGVSVTDEEIKDYYDNNIDQFKVPESVNASHILICYEGAFRCEKNRTKEEAEELAQKIYEMATLENFAELAMNYSDGPTGIKGGNLGVFPRGVMVKEFENAAFNLSENEISKPVETMFGYHVILVHEKIPAKTQPFDDVKGFIEQTLLKEKQKEIFNKFTQELRDNAEIILYGEDSNNNDNTDNNDGVNNDDNSNSGTSIKTFTDNGNDICVDDDGKPIIRLFTSSTCPHCQWIGDTFDNTVKEYIDNGEITAYHWDLTSGDNLLTEEVEEVPESEMEIFNDGNQGYVPYFVFGCKYTRIGNGYEQQDDLDAEANEFKAVIDKLLAEV